MKTDASEATSRAGGAGAIFRKTETSYENRIKTTVHGTVKAGARLYAHTTDRGLPPFLQYVYEFTLLFPETKDAVLFEKQSLKLRRIAEFEAKSSLNIDPNKWGLEMEAILDPNGRQRTQIKTYEEDLAYMPFDLFKSAKSKTPLQDIEKIVDNFLESNISLVSTEFRYETEFNTIGEDICGGPSYNIIPSRVKQPEDSAKPPGIAKDGSGLAATLYACKKMSERGMLHYSTSLHAQRELKIEKGTLNSLKSYLTLVNSSILGFDVQNVHDDNQLKVKFTICSGGKSVSIPLSQISDGTLKWISLVTAALTEPRIFSIEEPENYLHPNLQSQIVVVLREILFAEGVNKFTLMTTHSETLLNSCQPSELIIVYFEDGKTKAKRCSNADEISDEINRTGFGLGYYYLTNALQDD
jgi:hypothetical protein